MSKQLRQAIRAELFALDEAEYETPTAQEVLGRLWALATVEIFERADHARVLAETVAHSQKASLAASAKTGGINNAHMNLDFISDAIFNADIL